uniref:Transmembrane protein 267 n=1 Tax=Timema tahoe TaxID=61484 RepID=A0A7R9ID83_9NEOP|nr:unnamed protein product [Timema tahoe]
MLSQTSGSPILVQSSWLVTTAALGHLIRDAAQNGFWMCPLEPAPPLPYCVYITMICALPYVIRLERVAKPQKHAFHNEGIQPEEELAKRGFSIYKGPGKVWEILPPDICQKEEMASPVSAGRWTLKELRHNPGITLNQRGP